MATVSSSQTGHEKRRRKSYINDPEPPFSRQERDGHECSRSIDTKCRAFINMVGMNYAFVEKYGVILHVGSFNRNTSRTLHITKKSHVRVQSVGGVNITLSIKRTSSNRRIFPYHRG